MEFVLRFQAGMRLHLGEHTFEFMSHPFLPQNSGVVYCIEGAEAFIYQLRKLETQKLYALKVFKQSCRGAHIAHVVRYLAARNDLPYLGSRLCITADEYPSLVDELPELEYAVLMRWYQTPTWSDILASPPLSIHYSLLKARHLALASARALASLEEQGMAHSDLAGNNLLVAPDGREIRLLDLESMYIPGLPVPWRVSYGSPGYQHHHPGTHGCWCREGDRFAGAILLTEILTWWHPQVRALVPDDADALFRPQELQVTGTALWHMVRSVLAMFHHNLQALFDRAWASSTLSECPDLAAWEAVLRATLVDSS